ncbi:TOBE domain-containing protein [Lonepinella koalarum]|uniref:Molybdate transport system regulatory protein n=1 Tax=Lonepinella koalarum TaxID=53417 RepID=A0A4R1KTB3_9PAST|nr:TOBE domain-containing protein [Lonepinella koalarum]MDH2927480.1 transporter [Lonepinella koalarum]TCK68378.1 molybdate transport system regulatory protein [Lonepinella koalarum]TFJ89632.1 transporter [Lonepinella koalarum]
MAISARNQLKATVQTIKTGVTTDVIELVLASGEKLVASITSESTQNLGLKVGSEVVAIFKAPAVILSTDNDLILSSRNQFDATVQQVTDGAVNAEVLVKTEGGIELTTIITETSVKNLGLVTGSKVTALIKASHIVLGVKR